MKEFSDKKHSLNHNVSIFLQFSEVADDHGTTQILQEDESLLSLQNLQTRVKVVRKLMEEMNKPILQRRSISNGKQESDQLKPRRSSGKKGYANELNGSPKLQKLKTKASEVKNGMRMKDIPLDQVSDISLPREKVNVVGDDQMLELWETAEDGNRNAIEIKQLDQSEPPMTDTDVEKELGVDKLELSTRNTEPSYQELNDEKILDRLSSDAQKLESLQTTVQNLRRKLETNKKCRKVKNVDFETIKEQLLEADDAIVHLMDLNGQLVKNIEDCPPDEMASPRLKETVRIWRMKVVEQEEKGSERIERLQIELQKIQYMLMKLEDEKKNKFFKSKSVILRDFIHNGRKNSGGRRKKGPNCGCFKQSTSRKGNSL